MTTKAVPPRIAKTAAKKRATGDLNAEVFLRTLAKGLSVTAACKASKLARATAYMRRVSNPDFAMAWDEAIVEGTHVLEDEANRRALAGSDTMLIFLLKARDQKYRENSRVELTGKDGGAIKTEEVTRPMLTKEEWLKAHGLGTAARPAN